MPLLSCLYYIDSICQCLNREEVGLELDVVDVDVGLVEVLKIHLPVKQSTFKISAKNTFSAGAPSPGVVKIIDLKRK